VSEEAPRPKKRPAARAPRKPKRVSARRAREREDAAAPAPKARPAKKKKATRRAAAREGRPPAGDTRLEPAQPPAGEGAQEGEPPSDPGGSAKGPAQAGPQPTSGQGASAVRREAAAAIGEIAARLSPELDDPSMVDEKLLSTARQLLSTDYYLRQWGRLGMRGRSETVDEFGLDPTYEERMQPLLDLLYERYFRVEIGGVEHLPSQGGALLVCNHSGTLPWDGVMLKAAIRVAHPARRALRWLIEDFVFHSPFVGPFLNRLGAVRACQENAQRLLSRDALLAVFPEGVKGVAKPFRERYQLQRFGRGGHVRLALRMRVPLLPVAIVGAEETYPLLYRVRSFSKALGLPFIPVTPTFPWLGPLGLLPLPSRWRIEIGPPVGDLEVLQPADADNSLRVNELNEQVRTAVQGMLRHALDARGPNVFL